MLIFMGQRGKNRFTILMDAIANPETQKRTLEICDRLNEIEEKGFAKGEVDRLWKELEDLASLAELDVKS